MKAGRIRLNRIRAIAWKESLHIRRDPRSLGLALGIPLLMILLFGYALTLDVERVPLVVWDQGNTPSSRALIAEFTGSRYFDLRGRVDHRTEIERAIDTRAAGLALILPPDFGARLGQGQRVPVQVIADASDSNTAALALGYAEAVVARFNDAILLEQLERRSGAVPAGGFELRPRVWFNPDLKSRNFIIPGLVAVIMGLIAALLTSLTIAREWERGTMEQLIATPVRPIEVVVGKLLPYLGLGMVNLAVAVVMAVAWFGVPLRGSVTLLFSMGTLFTLGTLGQGLVLSIVARQQLLASQLAMVSTFLPAFLLSGFMFSIANMPAGVQAITYIVPARYFVALVKGIHLRGVGLEVLWGDALFLLGFAVLVCALAVLRFRKRLEP